MSAKEQVFAGIHTGVEEPLKKKHLSASDVLLPCSSLEAVYLEGTTTNRTKTQHSRGCGSYRPRRCNQAKSDQSGTGTVRCYDYDDYRSSDSDDSEDEDEEKDPPPKQTKAVELPKGKDETVTEKFTLSLAKAGSLESWTCMLIRALKR